MVTMNPVGSTINKGTAFSLAVTAVGSSTLSYQWRRGGAHLVNGGNISGADTATLTISAAELSDSGEYTVRVSNTAGSVFSQPATVTVLCVLASEGESFLIQSIAVSTNGDFTLAWESCSGHLYEVQTSDEPSASTGWTPRSLMIGKDGATTWTYTNAPAANHRFLPRAALQLRRRSGRRRPFQPGRVQSRHRLAQSRHRRRSVSGWVGGAVWLRIRWSPADRHADLDGDGYSNFQEYQLHTRPNASYQSPCRSALQSRGLVEAGRRNRNQRASIPP